MKLIEQVFPSHRNEIDRMMSVLTDDEKETAIELLKKNWFINQAILKTVFVKIVVKIQRPILRRKSYLVYSN